MAGRDDLVYDEDDYVPPGYVPPKRAGNRTKQFVVVAIVGVLVGAVLLMYVMRSRERTRFVRIESDRARQNAVLAANNMAGSRPSGPDGNWSRIIGVWSRVPDPEREISYPIRFEFRPDETAVVTRPDHEGKTTTREWQARVLLETSGSITLELHDLRNSPQLDHQHYRFKFREDGTLLLDDTIDGLVFTREK